MIQKSSGLKTVKPADLPKFVTYGLGGVAGAGKTHLLGTVGAGKALIMDTEGGNVTYNSKSFKSDPDASDNIDIITFDDVDSAQALAHRVESTLDHLIRTKNSDGYTLVALDSLTEFQERFLSLHVAPDKRQSYGALRDALYSIVSKARKVPAHTVFTARLKVTQDEVLGREVVRFEVSPGVYSVVSGLFDNIGFLNVERRGLGNNAKNVRTLDFTHNVRYNGKDRYGLGTMTDATFVKIQTLLDGGK